MSQATNNEILQEIKRRKEEEAYSLFTPWEYQQPFFHSTAKIRMALGGNQCFEGDTLIQRADGSSIPIKDIKIGEEILCYDTDSRCLVPTTVLAVWEKEGQVTRGYYSSYEQGFRATEQHNVFIKGSRNKLNKRMLKDLKRWNQVVCPIQEIEGKDTEDSKFIELLGFLLGDGCFTQLHNKGLQFTNTSSEIIKHVESLLPEGYRLRDCKNGDYFLSKINHKKGKNELINKLVELELDGKTASSKFIPNCVFTQSIDTRRKFVGGLIATDGWICNKDRIGFSSTSVRLAKDLQRLLRGLGIYSTLKIKKRSNNQKDEITLQICRKEYYNKFLQDIRVVSKNGELLRKKVKYNDIGCGLVPDNKTKVTTVYDLTVSHKDHNYIANGFLVSNSGKTLCGAIDLIWFLTGEHPVHKRPDKPVTIWVVGRTGEMLQQVIWEKMMEQFPKRLIKKIRRKEMVWELIGGDKIHFKSNEQGQDKFQSAEVDYIWFDEEPDEDVYKECLPRLVARNGIMIFTMTPVPERGITWIYDEFIVKSDLGELNEKFFKYFYFDTLENKALTEEAIEFSFGSMSEDEKQARLKGRFIIRKGLVLWAWDDDKHLVNYYEPTKDDKIIMSIDYGTTKHDPFVLVLVALRPNGQRILFEECRKVETPPVILCEIVKMYNKRYNPEVVLLDPKAAGFRQDLAFHNVFVQSGNADVMAGVGKMNDLLSQETLNGEPMLLVKRDIETVAEIRGYRFVKGKIRDKFNHGIDALRWACKVMLSPKLVTIEKIDKGYTIDDLKREIGFGRRKPRRNLRIG